MAKKTIYKYPLRVDDVQDVAMPRKAKILCVQIQSKTPCIWAEVDKKQTVVKRRFATYGTGYSLPDDSGTYIGTYQLQGGALVFHVYELETK